MSTFSIKSEYLIGIEEITKGTGTHKHTETESRYFDWHGRLPQSKESKSVFGWVNIALHISGGMKDNVGSIYVIIDSMTEFTNFNNPNAQVSIWFLAS